MLWTIVIHKLFLTKKNKLFYWQITLCSKFRRTGIEEAMPTYSVIIPGNGTGQRFKNELPKQFVLIRDRPLIYHTIKAFVDCSRQLRTDHKLNEIVVSCGAEFDEYVRTKVVEPIMEQNGSIAIKLVRGGKFRHQSIFNCLKYLAAHSSCTGMHRLPYNHLIKWWFWVKRLIILHVEHIVLVHDAVRPLVEVDLVRILIESASTYGVFIFYRFFFVLYNNNKK